MYRKHIIFLLFLLLGVQFATAQEDSLMDLREARIAVIIQEKHIYQGRHIILRRNYFQTTQTIVDVELQKSIPDPAAETTIYRSFLEAGFTRMVDQNQVDKIRDSDVVQAMINGDVSGAAGLASQLGVDIIIVGDAISELVGRVQGNLLSSRATMNARAIRVDNARILAVNSIQGAGLDLTPNIAAAKALGDVGKKMGDYMVGMIGKSNATTSSSGVKLTVTGLSSLSRLQELENALRGLNGVETVRRNEYRTGVATLDLSVNVSVQTLVDMMSALKSPRMEITDISGSAIKVSVR